MKPKPSSAVLVALLFVEGYTVVALSSTPSAAVVRSVSTTKSLEDTGTQGTASLRLQILLDQYPQAERYCQVGPTKFGRGLIATQDLAPGAVALRVPLEYTIMEWDPHRDEDTWTGRLAHRLMNERMMQSPTSAINFDSPTSAILQAYTQALPVPPSTPARGDWPISVLQEFDSKQFVEQIQQTQIWRYQQWENYCAGDHSMRQHFLDALDLVCSRAIRCGNRVLLVPLMDMANHASQPEGGGYFQIQSGENSICLHVGERGVRQGKEITLDYGSRINEEWLLHYGFLPTRNSLERVTLPETQRVVTWDDVRTQDTSLREACQKYLQQASTTLEEDLRQLHIADTNGVDFRLQTAVQYRINHKILLSAIAGQSQQSSTSFFFCPSLRPESVVKR